MPQFGQNHFVELAPGRVGWGVGLQGHSSAYLAVLIVLERRHSGRVVG